MQWTDKTPEPAPLPHSCMKSGDLNPDLELTVRPASNERQWQYFLLSFGYHTNRPHEECLEKWPREALELARKKLNEFEAQLSEVTDG